MELAKIIHVSGKAGLYKIISQGKNVIITESLVEEKRVPIYANDQANSLDNIEVYTYNDTINLIDVLRTIAKKEKSNQCISHKSSKDQLKDYFREIIPEYDEERVYHSDIKKIIQWYNILQSCNIINANTIKKELK